MYSHSHYAHETTSLFKTIYLKIVVNFVCYATYWRRKVEKHCCRRFSWLHDCRRELDFFVVL